MTKYIRIKSGEANFLLSERFDDVEKAANPNAQGELVECKVTGIKLDFTKVKKEKDGKAETKTFRSCKTFREENMKHILQQWIKLTNLKGIALD